MALCTEPREEFIPAPDTAVLRVFGLMQGQNIMNVLYFTRGGGWNIDLLNSLLSNFRDKFGTTIAPLLATSYKLVRLQATDVSEPNGIIAELNTDIDGEVSSPQLPNSVTLAIKFGTGFAGRSFRGRMYWPVFSESQVAGDIVDSSHVAAVLDALSSTIGTAESATDSQHVVASYCSGGVWRDTAVVTPVISYTSDGIVDTQRRRLLGRGA